MATSDTNLQQIEVLWARFKEQLAVDPTFTVRDFASAHPDYQDAIAQVFPLMHQLEGLATDQEAELSLPPSIGRYPIVRRIGVGGMGVVYEAQCDALRERIAIKVISSERIDAKNIKRFEQEARTVASLHHTNIVPIYEFGHESDEHFYTMRLIDGPNLSDVMRLAELGKHDDPSEFEETDVRSYQLLARLAGNWKFIAELGSQAAFALEYAHGRDVLHRDIKPGNLLVDNTDKLWITDFGLAKRVFSKTELTSVFQAVGTPRYMAPEQAKGMADPRSDTYSLGLTLYELVTLQESGGPYRHTGVDTPPPLRTLNSKIPSQLDRIIMKAIKANPAERYQSAREFGLELEQFALALENDAQHAPTKANRFPWLLTTVAAMFVCFSLAMANWLLPGLDEEIHVSVVEGQQFVARMEELMPNDWDRIRQASTPLQGKDAAQFDIAWDSGELAFREDTNFEVPTDADMDNVYQLSLGNRDLRIYVQNRNEPAVIDEFLFAQDGSTIKVTPKQTGSYWSLPVEDDQDRIFNGLHFGIQGGVDRARVNLTPQGIFALARDPEGTPLPDANQDGIYEIELSVVDSTQVWMLRLLEKGGGKIALVRERLVSGVQLESAQLAADCLIRRNVIDLATADGQTLFHIHRESDGKISLYSSRLKANGTLSAELLSSDCGLPSSTIALATLDGTQFYALARKQGDVDTTRLIQAILQEDGTFAVEMMGEASGLPITTSSLAWIDGKRFHHVRRQTNHLSRLCFSFLGTEFNDLPESSNNAILFDQPIRGHAAWVQQAAESQGISKAILFDTNE